MEPINIHWDTDQQQIVVAEFNQPWTWDEFHTAVQQIHTMIAAVSHTADVIIWHKVELPAGNPISHLSRTLKKQPPNMGRTIIISPPMSRPLSNFLRSIASIIEKAYPTARPVLSAETIDQARAMLAKRGESSVS